MCSCFHRSSSSHRSIRRVFLLQPAAGVFFCKLQKSCCKVFVFLRTTRHIFLVLFMLLELLHSFTCTQPAELNAWFCSVLALICSHLYSLFTVLYPFLVDSFLLCPKLSSSIYLTFFPSVPGSISIFILGRNAHKNLTTISKTKPNFPSDQGFQKKILFTQRMRNQ